MADLLKWLAASGDTLTVPGILAVNIVFILISLVKHWVVPGWIYTECCTDRDKLRSGAEKVAADLDLKVQQQELLIEQLRKRPRS